MRGFISAARSAGGSVVDDGSQCGFSHGAREATADVGRRNRRAASTWVTLIGVLMTLAGLSFEKIFAFRRNHIAFRSAPGWVASSPNPSICK